ncbi:hypothetical protein [Candidatus Cryosericum septentrionale]|jgi:hypothetical protein|uniref:Uncharacterized protein n=1 Tax=Candidatus Cryosericum septentrionale TaxID=2290913 RepID=A0A398DMD1_9BACT|nr:hypothetical protein [Candidatus Cryosericum septentrionale]RIE16722.1 hypothetical protein SMC1_05480 [Candidatus Cryosericum septentrionale]
MNDIRKSLESRSKAPRTARELAEYFGVPYKTAWGWFSGRVLPKNEEIRDQLMMLIQAETIPAEPEDGLPFRPSVHVVPVAAKGTVADKGSEQMLIDEVRSLAAELNAKLALLGEAVKATENSPAGTDHLLEVFLQQLYDLSSTLAVVASDESRRNAFRRRINKADVAYITTLLGALLDEQKFTLWQAFQDFPMKGGRRT